MTEEEWRAYVRSKYGLTAWGSFDQTLPRPYVISYLDASNNAHYGEGTSPEAAEREAETVTRIPAVADILHACEENDVG